MAETPRFKILSDEEMAKALRDSYAYDRPDITEEYITIEDITLAQAEQKHTLKQVIDWGNELCLQHHAGLVKHECEYCWAELEKGAEK